MTGIDFSYIEQDDLVLWYLGKFDDDMTPVLINMLNSSESDLGKSKKSISFLIAESFQNVIRHGVEQWKKSSSFGLFKKNENVHIFSSNLISTGDADAARARLKHVNQLEQEELRALFLKVIQSGQISSKGGAGLGIIEMARKSKRQMQYKFESNNGTTEFNLQLDKALSKKHSSIASIEESSKFNKSLRENGVILLFKGKFDSETIDNISRILMQNTLYNEALGIDGKTFFHICIEMLQNMDRHGTEDFSDHEKTFLVQMKGEELRIVTENIIEGHDVDKINSLFDKMKGMNSEELTTLYKSQLRLSVLNQERNAGVGLIDVMRSTKGNFTKSISAKEDNLVLTLTATLNISL